MASIASQITSATSFNPINDRGNHWLHTLNCMRSCFEHPPKCMASYEIVPLNVKQGWTENQSLSTSYQQPCNTASQRLHKLLNSDRQENYRIKNLKICKIDPQNSSTTCKSQGNDLAVSTALDKLYCHPFTFL